MELSFPAILLVLLLDVTKLLSLYHVEHTVAVLRIRGAIFRLLVGD